MRSLVPLQGCHQRLMPSYRLPQSVGSIRFLDELGMVHNPDSQEVAAAIPGRNLAGQDQHMTRLGQDEAKECSAVLSSLIVDVSAWAQPFCRDFRVRRRYRTPFTAHHHSFAFTTRSSPCLMPT